MPSSSLEQEAMERVARMYASYDRRPQPPKPEPKPEPRPEHPEHPGHPGHHPPHDPPPAAPQSGFLEQLMQDKDQSLILLLLVLLMKDGADLNLTLALVYLLL